MALTDSGNLSPADIAAVTGNSGGFGFGGDSGLWLIVLFLFIFAGGWGNGGGYGGGATPYILNNNTDATVQRGFDQSAVMSGLSGIQSALTNGFSDAAVAQCNQTMSLVQGQNAITNAVSNNRFDTVQAIANDRFDTVQAITNASNNLNTTLMQNEANRQQCCCDTRASIADLKFAVATENCADRTAISDGIRDVIASQTASTQAILNKLSQQEIEAKNSEIANLRTQLNMQNLAASQSAQTAQLIADNTAQTQYIVNRVAPYPIPSYTVPGPYGYGYGFNYGSYGIA
ncbi:MAG: hypothetical protein J6Y86_08140 [Pseudobutyrivibrio sp.]|nr:hypothetical protein [Pseudobutyrivibrio sp.]